MNLYDLSVPVLTEYLQRLLLIVDKISKRAEETNDSSLINAQLAAGMLPLAQQINTTAGFALRATFPLANLPIPELVFDAENYDMLRQTVVRSIDKLEALNREQFEQSKLLLIETKAGDATLQLSAFDYLTRYTLPNFYFHFSMVYAIARQQGVDIGKSDFDGIHDYQPGFSFV